MPAGQSLPSVHEASITWKCAIHLAGAARLRSPREHAPGLTSQQDWRLIGTLGVLLRGEHHSDPLSVKPDDLARVAFLTPDEVERRMLEISQFTVKDES